MALVFMQWSLVTECQERNLSEFLGRERIRRLHSGMNWMDLEAFLALMHVALWVMPLWFWGSWSDEEGGFQCHVFLFTACSQSGWDCGNDILGVHQMGLPFCNVFVWQLTKVTCFLMRICRALWVKGRELRSCLMWRCE